MIAAYISLFISFVCILVLTIILLRLRKIFNSEKIMDKIEIYMNKRIKELDSTAYKDLEMVRNASVNMRALLSQADETMKRYEEATERLRKKIAATENEGYSAVDKLNLSTNIEKNIDSDVSLSIAENELRQFDKDTEKIQPSQNWKNTYYFNRSVVIPEGINDIPAANNFVRVGKIKKKSDFSEAVKKLDNEGYSVSEIADELSCSTSEVQYIIDLGI